MGTVLASEDHIGSWSKRSSRRLSPTKIYQERFPYAQYKNTQCTESISDTGQLLDTMIQAVDVLVGCMCFSEIIVSIQFLIRRTQLHHYKVQEALTLRSYLKITAALSG